MKNCSCFLVSEMRKKILDEFFFCSKCLTNFFVSQKEGHLFIDNSLANLEESLACQIIVLFYFSVRSE